MYSTLATQSDEEGILTITLNRPERMNAFTVTMCHELRAVFERASVDDTVRAIIVTGAGKAFCAGMDLSGSSNPFGLNEDLHLSLEQLNARMNDHAVVNGVRDTGGLVTLAIHRCLKPVIAAINGVAVGIGATMTLAMDFRLAVRDTRMGFVFSKLGITPEACSTYFLPHLVGMQQALEWVYSAEVFPVEDGLRAGLIRSIHEPDELLPAARALARKLTHARSLTAMALTRRLVRFNPARDPEHAHKTESLAVHWLSQRDGAEGVAAFREKRFAVFAGNVSDGMPEGFEDWH